MNLFQLLQESIESLSGNKVRTTLTMLGIIIGVAAVIAMLGIGAGAQASVTQSVARIGANLLYVNSGGDSSTTLPLTMGETLSRRASVQRRLRQEALADGLIVIDEQLHLAH